MNRAIDFDGFEVCQCCVFSSNCRDEREGSRSMIIYGFCLSEGHFHTSRDDIFWCFSIIEHK